MTQAPAPDHGSPEACCCTDLASPEYETPGRLLTGRIETPSGQVQQVSTRRCVADIFGSWRVRWGIGRHRYAVRPGLYAVGDANADSQVFVTANYRMSFDRLRFALHGRDAWILVLDTRAINVWCAAGKGTFGVDELVGRIESAGLKSVVAHSKLVLPQLGAPGIDAGEVLKRTGMRVTYGPVRAEDLPAFIDAGMVATPEMRRVRFRTWDRLALVPIEMVISAKYVIFGIAAVVLLSGLGPDGYSAGNIQTAGVRSAIAVLAAALAGTVMGPVLLPVLPGRSFAMKGAGAGCLCILVLLATGVMDGMSVLERWAWCLLVPATASFITMNFTGSSTYTSFSGVKKEMRRAVPLQALAAVAGVVLWISHLFVR